MSKHSTYGFSLNKTRTLTKSALVVAVYIAVTMFMVPFSFGAIQFRLAESLNYLSLYNKRYIYALTLAVFVVNYYSFGPIDMIVGSLSTLAFLSLGRWVANRLIDPLAAKGRLKYDPMIYKYFILNVVFSVCMFTIAAELYILGFEAFWPAYISLALSEFLTLSVGTFIIYPIAQRIDFYE